MRLPPALAAILVLSACSGEKPLQLPTQPIDRAATCGIVAAAKARTSLADIKQPLPFEAQGKILHYAMLAASEGGSFDAQTANAVSRRMPQLESGVTGGKWQSLIPACAAAYPAAEKTEMELPRNRTDALLGCDETVDFVLLALESQNSDYSARLSDYRRLKRKLDAELVAGLVARAGSSPSAQQAERHKALAKAVALGPPTAVVEQCRKKYG